MVYPQTSCYILYTLRQSVIFVIQKIRPGSRAKTTFREKVVKTYCEGWSEGTGVAACMISTAQLDVTWERACVRGLHWIGLVVTHQTAYAQ